MQRKRSRRLRDRDRRQTCRDAARQDVRKHDGRLERRMTDLIFILIPYVPFVLIAFVTCDGSETVQAARGVGARLTACWASERCRYM